MRILALYKYFIIIIIIIINQINARAVIGQSAVVYYGALDWTTSTRLNSSTTFQFLFSGFTLSQHIPISSHELLSLPKTNMKNMGSGNVAGLKFETRTRTRTQSRTRSPI